MEVDVSEMILELAVGDILQVGERQLTVISVEAGEVTFRIDDPPLEAVASVPHLARQVDRTQIRSFSVRPR